MSQRKAKEYRQAMEQYRGAVEDVDDLKRRIGAMEARHRREDQLEEIRRRQARREAEQWEKKRKKSMEQARRIRAEDCRCPGGGPAAGTGHQSYDGGHSGGGGAGDHRNLWACHPADGGAGCVGRRGRGSERGGEDREGPAGLRVFLHGGAYVLRIPGLYADLLHGL